ncbi:MAG TPA: hypothetical protein VLI21_04515 [Casimicrobiaceae bacterium]|nr:hypothetical protein [Casimicrobiaceae bacterium]
MQRQDDKGQQGSRQQGQQNDSRPQQDRDLQRNKQSDRGPAPQDGGRDRQNSGSPQQNSQNVYGEGNYAASRQYNDATREFAQSGRVEQAARDAAPQSDADALQMQAAEDEGKRHAKGEDPALSKRGSLPPDQPNAPKPGKD